MGSYNNSLIQNQPFGTNYNEFNPNPIDGDSCQPKRDKFMHQYLMSDLIQIQFRNAICGENIMCDWNWNTYGDDELNGGGYFNLPPDSWSFGTDWAWNSATNSLCHTPTVGSSPASFTVSGGSTNTTFKVRFRITDYTAGTITPALTIGITSHIGTAESGDGYYEQTITGASGVLNYAIFTPSDDFEGCISEITVREFTGTISCENTNELTPNQDDGSLCHTTVYPASTVITGLLTIGTAYKFRVESTSSTGVVYLQNGAQSFEITNGLMDVFIHAYATDFTIYADAESDICITDLQIWVVDDITCELIRENENQTETSFQLNKTSYRDFTTFSVTPSDLVEEFSLTEGCFHFNYSSSCDNVVYHTNTFQIVDSLDSCKRMIEATGDCEQFGFYFGGGFKLSQRGLLQKGSPNYPSKNDIDTDAEGTYRRQFAEREKKYKFEVMWADEQFYDCLSVQLLLDLTIDDIDYFWKDTTLQPEYDKDGNSDLAQVAVDLFVGKVIRKDNCTECDALEEPQCTYTLTIDNSFGDYDGYAFTEFNYNNTVQSLGSIAITDLTALQTALEAYGLGVWDITTYAGVITITFTQFGANTFLGSLKLEQGGFDDKYLLFETSDCITARQGLRILFAQIYMSSDSQQLIVDIPDITRVDDWNTFFDLPANGTPFTDCVLIGNEVVLNGATEISFKDSLWQVGDAWKVLHIIDDISCVAALGKKSIAWDGDGCVSSVEFTFPAVVSADDNCFAGADSCTTLSLPVIETCGTLCFREMTAMDTFNLQSLLTVGDQAFKNNTATTYNLNSCTDLGGTSGNDSVWSGVTGLTMTINIDASQQTIDTGSPDGDLVSVSGANTVTINYV